MPDWLEDAALNPTLAMGRGALFRLLRSTATLKLGEFMSSTKTDRDPVA